MTNSLDGAHLRTILGQIQHDNLRIINDRFVGGLHLAIMTGRFLQMVIDGTKTVESRFYQQRRTPYCIAQPRDVVVFRQSGQQVHVAAILGETTYLSIPETSLDSIRKTWASRIGCNTDEFWSSKEKARWVSLLSLDFVFLIPPQKLLKRDRQAWVTYR